MRDLLVGSHHNMRTILKEEGWEPTALKFFYAWTSSGVLWYLARLLVLMLAVAELLWNTCVFDWTHSGVLCVWQDFLCITDVAGPILNTYVLT